MPTESLRIKGQFFNLRTQLSLFPSKGYKPESREVTRVEEFISSVDSVNDESALTNISKIISKNVVVLDLNFDSWNLISPNGFKEKKIDLSLIKPNKVLQDNLMSSLKLYPVIATDKETQLINYDILKEYIKQADFKLEKNAKPDFIVLSGEMVWSMWLNHNMTAFVLSKLFTKDVLVNVDRFGIWATLCRNFNSSGIIGGINQQALGPNLYFFTPSKHEKKILLQKEDDKRIMHIDGKIRFVEDVKGYILNDQTVLPDYLVIGGDEVNYNNSFQTECFRKSFTRISRHADLEMAFPEQEAVINEEKSIYQEKQYKIINLLEYPAKLKLLVSHGQKVEKNEVIAQNLSFAGKILGESFVSPIDGYVDLSKQSEGLILLWHEINEHTSINFNEWGRMMGGQDKKFYKLKSDFCKIPLELVMGKSVSGILVRDILPDFDNIPKILVSSFQDFRNYKAEQLINEKVRGVILENVTYKQISSIIKDKPEIFSLFSVAAMDSFSEDVNPVFIRQLNSMLGKLSVLYENGIMVVDKKPFISSKSENKYAKYISYNSKFRYYKETRATKLGKVLLSNGKDLIEADICNLVYVEDGNN